MKNVRESQFGKGIVKSIKLKFRTHKHDYYKVGWYEVEENNLMYSNRIYKCMKCDKVIHVDGRRDPYAR